ncbi:MAG: helix-turn-helix domain-containing protein [Thermodesulfobacteriota bacterium]
MKRIEEQTYYEILEVSPNATVKEIQRAYEHAKETFHRDSLAIYSLFSEEEVNEIQAAIEESYRVLADEALRKGYDQSSLPLSVGQKLEEPVEVLGIEQAKKSSLSFTGLSFNVEDGAAYRGKILRQIREKMGIDLKTISSETKISVKILEWIEEEVLERLPATVYLKGFLRNYAQSLGLDPQKVVEGYFQFLSENRKGNSVPSPHSTPFWKRGEE